MGDDTRQTVLLAIHTLYGQDTSQQGAASAWLTNFSNSAEAWPIAVTLLDEPSLEAKFFAVNMLLSKTRRDWTRLTADQRTQLAAAVRYKAGAHCRTRCQVDMTFFGNPNNAKLRADTGSRAR